MDRTSISVNALPFRAIVKGIVARATDGAAPSRPAKLFGFRTSPRIAKIETTTPPTTNRTRNSVIVNSEALWAPMCDFSSSVTPGLKGVCQSVLGVLSHGIPGIVGCIQDYRAIGSRGAVLDVGRCSGPGTMRTTEKPSANFGTVTYHFAATVFTGRRERLDCAFKAVEYVSHAG